MLRLMLRIQPRSGAHGVLALPLASRGFKAGVKCASVQNKSLGEFHRGILKSLSSDYFAANATHFGLWNTRLPESEQPESSQQSIEDLDAVDALAAFVVAAAVEMAAGLSLESLAAGLVVAALSSPACTEEIAANRD